MNRYLYEFFRASREEEDIDVAAEALHHAKHGRIHTGIGSSDVHIKHKFRSNRDQFWSRVYGPSNMPRAKVMK